MKSLCWCSSPRRARPSRSRRAPAARPDPPTASPSAARTTGPRLPHARRIGDPLQLGSPSGAGSSLTSSTRKAPSTGSRVGTGWPSRRRRLRLALQRRRPRSAWCRGSRPAPQRRANRLGRLGAPSASRWSRPRPRHGRHEDRRPRRLTGVPATSPRGRRAPPAPRLGSFLTAPWGDPDLGGEGADPVTTRASAL